MNNYRLAVRIFGANVRVARMARLLTRRQLAEMCGLTANDVFRIEKGRQDVSLIDVLTICDALAVPLVLIIPHTVK
jgi:transcriptional regulator with XRE-family HTH domain